MMVGDEKSPTFHDFLGMSSAADGGGGDIGGAMTGSSDLGSEMHGVNNSEGFHFHGRKSAISEPEASNTVLGRKRSSSSPYVNLIRDRMLSVGSDSFENSCLTKAFRKEVVNERLEKSHHEDMPSSIQPPPRPTYSLLSHPPIRPDSIISKWERSIPTNPGPMNLYSSRFGQSSATLASQAAADEGSRPGMKSSGILKIVNSSSIGAGERNTTGAIPYSNRLKAPQIVEPESSNFPTCNNFASTGRQMTIFYAGQAHVFDDVHPNKADVIMALVGSNGASWSTNYSKLGIGVAKAPNVENELRTNLPLSIPRVSKIPQTDNLQNITPGGHEV